VELRVLMVKILQCRWC